VKTKQDSPLNETQRSLVEKKFEILQRASFGFTQDRLLHIQEEDLKSWTDQCVKELRRKIAAAGPAHMKTTLIDFPQLRCASLQCRPQPIQADGARSEKGFGPVIGSAPYA
jgi:hypothetical protein